MEFVVATEELSDLESLDSWLGGDPDAGIRVSQRRTPIREGEMGALTDALIVSVGAGGAVSGLATMLRAWLLRPRHAHIKLTVKVGKRETKIDADRVRTEDLARILAALTEDEP